MPAASVVICTHNPRGDYLRRVLDALKAQTLPETTWELLLIDNASKERLADAWDLSWHPNGRHIREDNLGLTPARLRGISEAKAELVVFVDDDNVLEPSYLEGALRIGAECPMLGVWGGSLRPEFESAPPDCLLPWIHYLAIGSVERDAWSNFWSHGMDATPVGAGMCVRSVVAREYAWRTGNDAQALSLDRKGSSLASAGDFDIVFTAFKMGLGAGRFKCLSLTHLIPSFRLEEDYLVRLVESCVYSTQVVYARNGHPHGLPQQTWKRRLAEWLRYRLKSSRDRRFLEAHARGRRNAQQYLRETGIGSYQS